MLKPLIKYTGGKFREYNKIKQFLPKTFINYYEPFVGGGGVLFRLYNEQKLKHNIYINDISHSLIDFYNSITSEHLQTWLQQLSNTWNSIHEFADNFYSKFQQNFKSELLNSIDNSFLDSKDTLLYINQNVNDKNFLFHDFSLTNKIIHELKNKLCRFKKKNLTEQDFKNNIVYKCITTAIHQAFYFIIRDMYNDWNCYGNTQKYNKFEQITQWIFIREYCFGSMFRYGTNGEFNIPYGGFSYNNKCFQCKVDSITSKETVQLFKKVNAQCKDFETIITKWNPNENDFMFLDPPYDSTFKEYDGNSFNHQDHERLANLLNNTKCKWLMAIGKTQFITNLYQNSNIIEYDKTYMYQARGEYDNKNTKHLIITNYQI